MLLNETFEQGNKICGDCVIRNIFSEFFYQSIHFIWDGSYSLQWTDELFGLEVNEGTPEQREIRSL